MNLARLTAALILSASAATAQSVTSDSQSQSGSYSGVNIEGSTTDFSDQVPGMGAPSMSHTTSCALSASGAVSGPGFGIAFGNGRIDDECNTREEARFLHDLLTQRPSYARKAAIHHACSRDKSMRKTLVAIGICKVVRK
jgi:hypothetical protein